MAYLAIALALVFALLPTALRPPPDQANAAAELSPDAPPDENQDSIIAALNRGSTGTAGAGTGEGGLGDGVGGIGGGPGGTKPAACPRGFGNPPRQIASVYSVPCALAFSGDNGGATYKGVTASEVRVAIVHSTPTFQTSYDGPVPTTPQDGETTADRTYRVYQEYFNRAFQLYGRRLQLYSFRPDVTEESNRAKVAEADTLGVFAVFADQAPALDEAARRKILAWGGYQYGAGWFKDKAPFAWSWHMDGTKQMEFMSEYICKKLVGKKAVHAGDPDFKTKTRKFGAFNFDDSVNWGPAVGPDLKRFLKRDCDTEIVMVNYADSSSSDLATGVAKFRQEGVTSVIMLTEYQGPLYVPASATAQGYFPEWILTGRWLQDANGIGSNADPAQWKNAFGISARQAQRPWEDMDWWHAYKSLDPNADPDAYVGEFLFYPLLQILNGVQRAGPKLDPQSFEQGLFSWGKRFGNPGSAVGGGFGPGDYTFPDDITEIWWDPTAKDPSAAASNRNAGTASPGAYVYVRNAQRYKLGEIPREDSLVFREGTSEPKD